MVRGLFRRCDALAAQGIDVDAIDAGYYWVTWTEAAKPKWDHIPNDPQVVFIETHETDLGSDDEVLLEEPEVWLAGSDTPRKVAEFVWLEGPLAMSVKSRRGRGLNDPRRLARNDDPSTSSEAARKVVHKLTGMRLRALEYVVAHPGAIARELSDFAKDRDERKIGRRLPELEEMGLVRRGPTRKCAVTGNECATWWPTGKR